MRVIKRHKIQSKQFADEAGRSYENARPSRSSKGGHGAARATVQNRCPALHAVAEDTGAILAAARVGAACVAGTGLPSDQKDQGFEAVGVVLSRQQRRAGIPPLAGAVYSVANHGR